jgi:hypothetical protein
MNRLVRVTALLTALAWSCSVRAEDPTGKPYVISPSANPAPVAVCKPCNLQLAIKPTAPWVLKNTTPLKVTLATTEELKVAKPTLTAADLIDAPDASKAVASECEGVRPGATKVNADLSFFLCTEEICQRYTDKAELSIEVK